MPITKPHIVAVPVHGQGHITPMMYLCEYLAKQGFSITFVLKADIIPAFEMVTKKATWPPAGADITYRRIYSDIPIPDSSMFRKDGKINLPFLFDYDLSFITKLTELLLELQPVQPVSCLLCDYEGSWAVDVANKLKLPSAVLFSGCATWSWIENELSSLISSNIVPMQEDELRKDEDYLILKDPEVWRSEIPSHYWNDRALHELCTEWKSAKAFRNASFVLVSSCEELEGQIVHVMKDTVGDKYLPVGPLFFLNEDPTTVGFLEGDYECLKWLDMQPKESVLYIAFGSLAKMSGRQLEEFVMGLEASEQRFLWVTRRDVDLEDTEVYERWYEGNVNIKERGKLVSWSPQMKVLSHASVGGFVSHCGWNSTFEAVSVGQPILCWPCLFEQRLNSRLVVKDWKVGVGFSKGEGNVVAKEEVERVIRFVMEEEGGRALRERAQRLSVEMRRAASPEGSSCKNLQTFIQRFGIL